MQAGLPPRTGPACAAARAAERGRLHAHRQFAEHAGRGRSHLRARGAARVYLQRVDRLPLRETPDRRGAAPR